MSYESIVGFSDLPKPVIVYGAIISLACFFFYFRKIYSCLSDSKTANFMKLFPQHKTKKKDAVLGFYALLRK